MLHWQYQHDWKHKKPRLRVLICNWVYNYFWNDFHAKIFIFLRMEKHNTMKSTTTSVYFNIQMFPSVFFTHSHFRPVVSFVLTDREYAYPLHLSIMADLNISGYEILRAKSIKPMMLSECRLDVISSNEKSGKCNNNIFPIRFFLSHCRYRCTKNAISIAAGCKLLLTRWIPPFCHRSE